MAMPSHSAVRLCLTENRPVGLEATPQEHEAQPPNLSR